MFETQLGAKGQDTDSGTFKSLEKKGIRENSNDEKISIVAMRLEAFVF